MKKLATIIVTLIAMLLTSCGHNEDTTNYNENTTSYSEDTTSYTYTEVPTSYISADYFVTDSVEELVNHAQYVYEGKVTRVYFDTLNEYTGLPDKNGGGDNPTAGLYTIYEVEITATYKGTSKEKTKIKIKMFGGTDEYGLEEQYRVLNAANIPRRRVFDDVLTLSVGKTYIFFTNEVDGFCEDGRGPTQYALCSDDSNAPYGITYSKVKEYVTKEEFLNPSEVPTTYVAFPSMLTTPKEIAQSGEVIYTGIVDKVDTVIVDGQLRTRIQVSVLELYKGKNVSIIEVEGGTDDYDVAEQYRQLNKAGIEERMVYENLITPKQNQIYIFVHNESVETKGYLRCSVNNPAQYAFCIDDSNAPGGVNYSKLREYLLKNYEMQETPIKKYFMED